MILFVMVIDLEGAEEADEVAAAGGQRLPNPAGVQVFQVKVEIYQSRMPSITECFPFSCASQRTFAKDLILNLLLLVPALILK